MIVGPALDALANAGLDVGSWAFWGTLDTLNPLNYI